ncbi:MAG: MGMT family protein, partial [Bacteroidales bacterium]|nr:MGMT family protein [Bacteroidales bacterium]
MAPSGSFFIKAYDLVSRVMAGRVTSYGAIAEYLGLRGSARVARWVMNASHTQMNDVPAHRVVNRNGMLIGKHHFGGSLTMRNF